jgi:cytochrome c oxidase assembly factor CtaG
MIPWIVMAVVAVPLVVIAFVVMRRKTAAGERLADDDAQARAEQEFEEAEAYETRWREEDKKRSRQERFP